MPNYRVTFHNGPNGNLYKNVDLIASSYEEAEALAYQKNGGVHALRMHGFTGCTIMEINEGPKVIGIEIECTDTCLKRNFRDYMFIKANTERQAVEYYNRNLIGKHFWFNANKEDASGKCVRGRVMSTYFAAGPCNALFDATK